VLRVQLRQSKSILELQQDALILIRYIVLLIIFSKFFEVDSYPYFLRVVATSVGEHFRVVAA
jgi:hypothetical protein